MMSFDQWYFDHTGINTEDLTDEEYEALWEDSALVLSYMSDSAVEPIEKHIDGML